MIFIIQDFTDLCSAIVVPHHECLHVTQITCTLTPLHIPGHEFQGDHRGFWHGPVVCDFPLALTNYHHYDSHTEGCDIFSWDNINISMLTCSRWQCSTDFYRSDLVRWVILCDCLIHILRRSSGSVILWRIIFTCPLRENPNCKLIQNCFEWSPLSYGETFLSWWEWSLLAQSVNSLVSWKMGIPMGDSGHFRHCSTPPSPGD